MAVPSGRFTPLIDALRTEYPPHVVTRDSSSTAWPLGVLPPIAGPVIDALTLLGWPLIFGQPAGPSGGGGVMLAVNCWLAVLPVASVALTVKVDCPTVVDDPGDLPVRSERQTGRQGAPGQRKGVRRRCVALNAHLREVEVVDDRVAQ
jgi:hypothetical protein